MDESDDTVRYYMDGAVEWHIKESHGRDGSSPSHTVLCGREQWGEFRFFSVQQWVGVSFFVFFTKLKLPGSLTCE